MKSAWKLWAAWLVTVIASAVVGLLTGKQIAVPPPPILPIGAPPAEVRAMGWVDEPAEVQAITRTLPIQVFRDTPAGKEAALPDRAYLWDAAKKARGSHIPARDQGQVGSCVSFGAACAIEYLEGVQIAGGSGEQWKDIAQEPIYGGSRVQIGGGRISGDGSTGVWAAQWVSQFGVVARGKYDSLDLTSYSESRCRQYGDQGCPQSLVPIAKERPVKSIAPVRTTAELRSALASGYPVTVASNVGFGQRGPYTRDRDGFLRASGTWAHQMCFIGYRTQGRAGFYIMNSWGSTWVSGPKGEGDPPDGGFWCDEATAQRMLSAGDSWAYSSFTGFPARKLDWFVSQPARRDSLTLRPEVALSW